MDQANQNALWKEAITKEMKNVSIYFEMLEEGEELPASYKLAIIYHIIFDVKTDFTRKARYMLDGHKTNDSKGITYAVVLCREKVPGSHSPTRR